MYVCTYILGTVHTSTYRGTQGVGISVPTLPPTYKLGMLCVRSNLFSFTADSAKPVILFRFTVMISETPLTLEQRKRRKKLDLTAMGISFCYASHEDGC